VNDRSWVVDLVGREIHFYRDPNGRSYEQRMTAGGGTGLIALLNLAVNLNDLF
jgi:hypothetical protein